MSVNFRSRSLRLDLKNEICFTHLFLYAHKRSISLKGRAVRKNLSSVHSLERDISITDIYAPVIADSSAALMVGGIETFEVAAENDENVTNREGSRSH